MSMRSPLTFIGSLLGQPKSLIINSKGIMFYIVPKFSAIGKLFCVCGHLPVLPFTFSSSSSSSFSPEMGRWGERWRDRRDRNIAYILTNIECGCGWILYVTHQNKLSFPFFPNFTKKWHGIHVLLWQPNGTRWFIRTKSIWSSFWVERGAVSMQLALKFWRLIDMDGRSTQWKFILNNCDIFMVLKKFV